MQGLGVLSRVGVASELVAGTPEASVDVFLPILSESVMGSRGNVPSGSIVGDSMVQGVAPGVIDVGGSLSMEFDGQVSGQPVWLWNGDAGYTPTAISASLGAATAAPTGAAAAGGSLTAGSYLYKVSTLVQRTIDGVVLIMPGSSESAAIVTATTNLTVNLTWSNPGSFPTGYTHYGTIIWRTLIGGLTGTQGWLDVNLGTGNTYSDNGSRTVDSNVTPYAASLYSHSFKGSPPVSAGDRLTPFTYFSCKDNDIAERYSFCLMDSMKIAVPGIGEKLAAEFSLKGTQIDTIANFAPSFVPLQPFVGWQATVSITGQQDVTAESFEINCSNSVNPVPGLRGVPYNRAVISGKREVKVNFNRQFGDHDFWDTMLAGAEFSIALTTYGGSVASPVAHGLTPMQTGTIAMIPWQYSLKIELFRCIIDKAGGSIGGPDRIIEQISASCFKDASQGTEMEITMINTTAAYA